VGYGEKCIPAIFATNSTNKRSWFDSTYDDDVWEIDTTKISNVKWYKDRHYESRSKHIVTFQDIPKEAIKLIYEGSGKDSGLMESINKSEEKKLKLVKEMIYSLFDEVEFIEVDTNYEGKPLIKIYHDVEDTAANYDNWFTHRIIDEIKEMTGDGVILSPYWAARWDWKYKNADFYIDVEKIEYDNLGNVINESSIKEKSLIKLLEKDGLYNFIEMTGLDFNQVRSLLKHIDNPKEILKQYIREFVLEKGGVSGENYGSIFAVQIPLSNTKYVEDILVHDEDSIAVEMWEYHLDEYGHREQKDQYLTTINNLTNDELLSIISWMIETIKNGYRD
jgi:hypothetical protein